MSVSRAQGLGWGDCAGLGNTFKGALEGTSISSPCCSPQALLCVSWSSGAPCRDENVQRQGLGKGQSQAYGWQDVIETGLVSVPLG